MTTEQLAHLAETINMPVAMNCKDNDWKEAFNEYNADVKKHKGKNKIPAFLGGQPLRTDCQPAYTVVHRYLESKKRNGKK